MNRDMDHWQEMLPQARTQHKPALMTVDLYYNRVCMGALHYQEAQGDTYSPACC